MQRAFDRDKKQFRPSIQNTSVKCINAATVISSEQVLSTWKLLRIFSTEEALLHLIGESKQNILIPSDFVIIEASSFRRGKLKIKIFPPFI